MRPYLTIPAAVIAAAYRGDSLPEIGRAIGASRQRALQWLEAAGVREVWAERRRQLRAERAHLREITKAGELTADQVQFIREAKARGYRIEVWSASIVRCEGLRVRWHRVDSIWHCRTGNMGYGRVWLVGDPALHVVTLLGHVRVLVASPVPAKPGHLNIGEDVLEFPEVWPSLSSLRAAIRDGKRRSWLPVNEATVIRTGRKFRGVRSVAGAPPRNERKALGLCVDCGKPKGESRSRLLCPNCQAAHSLRVHLKRKRRKRAGLCPDCGGAREDQRWKCCVACRARIVESNHRHRDKDRKLRRAA